jgi:hypothetical protein
MFSMKTFGFARQVGRAKRALALGAVMSKMVEAVAHRVEAEAKRNCPARTGRLRAGYGVKRLGPGRWAIVNDVYYGPFVEFGTGDVGEAMYEKILEDEPEITFTAGHRGMEAQPHLRPAVRKGRDVMKRAGRRLIKGYIH